MADLAHPNTSPNITNRMLGPKPSARPQSSYLSRLMSWLRLKNYQYEVTFSLYMLTTTEKIIFNTILLTLISLLVTAAYLYLPGHISIIYSRIWYYISGEFTHAHHIGDSGAAGGGKSLIKKVVQVSKEVLVTSTLSGTTIQGLKAEL